MTAHDATVCRLTARTFAARALAVRGAARRIVDVKNRRLLFWGRREVRDLGDEGRLAATRMFRY